MDNDKIIGSMVNMTVDIGRQCSSLKENYYPIYFIHFLKIFIFYINYLLILCYYSFMSILK